MRNHCTSIGDAVKKVQVFALAFAVLGIIIICCIHGEWVQANKKWQQKWQSDVIHARIEQADDIVEVRKLAEYCRRSADSTYGALVGINKAATILMIAETCQILYITILLLRITRCVR